MARGAIPPEAPEKLAVRVAIAAPTGTAANRLGRMADTTVAVETLPDVPSAPASEGSPPNETESDEKTPVVAAAPPKPSFEVEDEACCEGWLNKGSVSNAITFVIMVIFIILKIGDDDNLAIDYGLAFGLFGFAVRVALRDRWRPFLFLPISAAPALPQSLRPPGRAYAGRGHELAGGEDAL